MVASHLVTTWHATHHQHTPPTRAAARTHRGGGLPGAAPGGGLPGLALRLPWSSVSRAPGSQPALGQGCTWPGPPLAVAQCQQRSRLTAGTGPRLHLAWPSACRGPVSAALQAHCRHWAKAALGLALRLPDCCEPWPSVSSGRSLPLRVKLQVQPGQVGGRGRPKGGAAGPGPWFGPAISVFSSCAVLPFMCMFNRK